MRLDLYLVPVRGNTVRLPRVNLHLVQAMIYGLFEKSFAQVLHDVGFERDNRRFKLFSFSWPKGQGRPKMEDGAISFEAPLQVVVTSPLNRILEQISGGALCGGPLRIGNNELECVEVKVFRPAPKNNSVTVKALSPITCYTTEPESGDRKPFIHYHGPEDQEFAAQIDGNLKKKFSLIYPGEEIPQEVVKVIPLGEPRKQAAMFRPKDTVPIVGWWGKYRLEGPDVLLQLALDAGIGAKNSGGWGCLEAPER